MERLQDDHRKYTNLAAKTQLKLHDKDPTHSNELFGSCLMSKGSPMPNMNLIHWKAKELLSYYCSFHGNLVAVAMKHATDLYCPKEA